MNRITANDPIENAVSDAILNAKQGLVHVCCVANPDLSRIRYRLGRSAASAAQEHLAQFVAKPFQALGGSLLRDRDTCYGIVSGHSTDTFAEALATIQRGPIEPLIWGDQTLSLRTVVGWSTGERGQTSAAEMIDAAWLGLEMARVSGTPQALCHRASLDSSLASLSLAADLGRALGTTGLELHYQPKVSMGTLELQGVEALLRWSHPSYGHVGPMDILRVAQMCGLMNDLNHWVLRQAVSQVAEWRRAGRAVPVAVNLSAGSLVDHALVEEVRGLLNEFDVPGDQLILEVTESDLLENPAAAQVTAWALGDLGVTLSLDDFGTGCSTLTQLRQIPANEIKIDRSFISNALADEAAEKIVCAVVDLAHMLGKRVVAEGVEDMATWRWAARAEVRRRPGLPVHTAVRPDPAPRFPG